jgi:hypothetical protein
MLPLLLFSSVAHAREIVFPSSSGYSTSDQVILGGPWSPDVSGAKFAGLNTYANLPYVHCLAKDTDEVEKFDIGILGAPFDTVSLICFVDVSGSSGCGAVTLWHPECCAAVVFVAQSTILLHLLGLFPRWSVVRVQHAARHLKRIVHHLSGISNFNQDAWMIRAATTCSYLIAWSHARTHVNGKRCSTPTIGVVLLLLDWRLTVNRL